MEVKTSLQYGFSGDNIRQVSVYQVICTSLPFKTSLVSGDVMIWEVKVIP